MDAVKPKERASVSESSREGVSEHENLSGGQQFDFLNWLYWNLWWQQYSFWNVVHHQSFSQHFNGSQIPNTGMGQQPPSTVPQFNANMGMSPLLRPAVPEIRTRVLSGYESCMAPLWRRGLAELIDTLLVGLVLRFYLPNLDYRVPELLFEGREMWDDLSEEDLWEARDTLLLFIYSTMIHRALHVVLEALFVCVFKATPGKWLMRLEVWHCTNTPRLTRTNPGHSIRVEPAGNISLLMSLGRSCFKSTVSLVIPLVVFFFQLERGRTLYDRFFRTVVVDTYSLNKPSYTIISNSSDDS